MKVCRYGLINLVILISSCSSDRERISENQGWLQVDLSHQIVEEAIDTLIAIITIEQALSEEIVAHYQKILPTDSSNLVTILLDKGEHRLLNLIIVDLSGNTVLEVQDQKTDYPKHRRKRLPWFFEIKPKEVVVFSPDLTRSNSITLHHPGSELFSNAPKAPAELRLQVFAHNPVEDQLSLIASRIEVRAQEEVLYVKELSRHLHSIHLPGSYEGYTLKVSGMGTHFEEYFTRDQLLTNGFITIMLKTNLNKPLASYPFDANGHDIMDFAEATLHGASPATDRYGAKSSALSLDGVNDYIELGSDFDLEYKTISMWVKTGSIPDEDQMIYSSDHASLKYGGCGMATVLREGKKKLHLNAGSRSAFRKEIQENTWYHIVMTANPKECRYYVNGVFQQNEKRGLRHSRNGVAFTTIGATRLLDRHFEGWIDELKIFDEVLSEKQILLLYHHF